MKLHRCMDSKSTLQPRNQVSASCASTVVWRRWLAPAGLLCTAIVLQSFAALNPKLTEHLYSRGLYPYVGRITSFVNRVTTISLSEVLITAALALLVGLIVWHVRELYSRRLTLRAFAVSGLSKLLWLAGGGLMAFLLVWGLNYQRQPLSVTMGFERREASIDELVLINRAIVENVNRNFREAHAGGVVEEHDRVPLDQSELISRLESAYKQEAAVIGLTGEDFGPPKPIYFSRLMTRLGITGLYMPFTGEPNFNTEPPGFDLPYTLAHEMAHQRGFAREDEANFIAFLVCTGSSHPYIRYSGYLNSLSVLGALACVAPERYRELVDALDTGPRADLKARSQFWLRHRGRVSGWGHQINDAYLRANRIRSGVRNYNDAVSLIIGYYLCSVTRSSVNRRFTRCKLAVNPIVVSMTGRTDGAANRTKQHKLSNCTRLQSWHGGCGTSSVIRRNVLGRFDFTEFEFVELAVGLFGRLN